DLLTRVVKARKAGLVILDPIDSYVDEGVHENDSQAVRHCLEAAADLAERTGAAVVGSRHPGKDPTNVCPGGRARRAVRRVIVELVEEEGEEKQRYPRPYKYSCGDPPPPLSFRLVRAAAGPPVWTQGKAVAPEVADLARVLPDKEERAKVEAATELLRN